MSPEAIDTASAAPAATPPAVKVIVAIHGIGEQRRCETIRAVAERFASDFGPLYPQLPLLPLGHFHVNSETEVKLSQLSAGPWAPDDPRQQIYFAEIYWADIPRTVAKAADTLEEAKAWGRSVVSRAHAMYDIQVRRGRPAPGDDPAGHDAPPCRLHDDDFHLAAGAVDEVVETVGVLENLLAVLDKAGVAKFDLAPLLRDYVGDVQIVADFPEYRQLILARFHRLMELVDERLAQRFPGVPREIHIVAHSEGTVVAFLGLLKALSGERVTKEGSSPPPGSVDWVRSVRGFMTLGAPIDKHLVLWPEMWEGLAQRLADVPIGQIKWRNYYDLGDPVGFRLDTAEHWLAGRFTAFEFDTEAHDHGFSRYLLPGQAHVQYWHDPPVFRHFIDEVVLGREAEPPPDRPLMGLVSTAIPYLVSGALHAGAVFLLYKAVANYLDKDHVLTFSTLNNVCALASLLMASTFAARLPRLVNQRLAFWWLVAMSGFGVLCVPALLWGPARGSVFGDFFGKPWLPALEALQAELLDPASVGTAVLVGFAALLASSGWWASRKPRHGRRWLLGGGGAFVALTIGLRLMAGGGAEGQPFWPVVLGYLGFLYAWWLAVLVFDLSFIWHEYVRRSTATRAMYHWHRGEDMPPRRPFGMQGEEARHGHHAA